MLVIILVKPGTNSETENTCGYKDKGNEKSKVDKSSKIKLVMKEIECISVS